MLLGQSVFQSVLTRLGEEVKDDDEIRGPSFRIHGLSHGFVAASAGPALSGQTEAYFDFLPELNFPEIDSSDVEEAHLPVEEEEALPPPPPSYLFRLSVEEIAEELALGPAETQQTLSDKRRRFARANHPDTVPPDLRENAEIRMKTANHLLDLAARKKIKPFR